MKKKIVSIILSICIMINSNPIHVYAENASSVNEKYIDMGAYTVGNNMIVNQLLQQTRLTARQGHGFAAELGNNLIDQMKGVDTTIVGNDNVENGADRLIIRRNGAKVWIQDKYYNNARDSIDACFESGNFRYVDADGNPMQIEVPRDQYDDVVELMQKRIEKGLLKNVGISDPAEAKNIVRKGSLTYKQAVKLAKAGTIESLTYDAIKGTVSAGCSLGISSLIVYSVSRLNGESAEDSLKIAAIEGLKTGGVVFGTSIISSQLSRTGAIKVFAPTSEALVKLFGDDFAVALLKSVGKETVGLTDNVIRSQASKILRSQGMATGITVVLLTLDDVVEIVRGRISVEQLLKNLAIATAGAVAGYAGSVIGGVAGSAIAPGMGTTAGSVIGGVVVGGVVGYGTEKVLGIFVKDDVDKMLDIIEERFLKIGQEYLLSEDEANNVADKLKEELSGEKLKDMFASEDQGKYAEEIIEPLIKTEASNRNIIVAPTAAEMRMELKSSLEGVVFIH